MYLTRNQASRLRDRGFESHPFRHRINDLPNILSSRNRAFNSVDTRATAPILDRKVFFRSLLKLQLKPRMLSVLASVHKDLRLCDLCKELGMARTTL